MSLGGSKAALTSGTRGLLLKWSQARGQWRDAKALEFEQKYIIELLASVDVAGTVIDDLEKLLVKARRDCE